MKTRNLEKTSHQLDFGALVDNHSDYLISYAFFKVSKKEDAEDLVQETFLSAYKSSGKFRRDASPRTWLMSILRNKIIDYYRKKSTHQEMNNYLEDTEEAFGEHHFNKNNHGRWKYDIDKNYFSNSTEAFIESREFQETLRFCLEKLPSRLRSIFVSKYIDAKKSKEICKEHKISSSNYWTIVFRSKTLLRNCLEKKGVEL